MTTGWKVVDKNPVSQEIYDYLKSELRKKNKGRVFDFFNFLKDSVKDRTVLDIGVVEHDVSHIESETWKHQFIKKWSKYVVGVDILEDEVAYLVKKGFDVVVADATSEIDLGRKFERVIIGDVIEHVDNPVALLKFAARHLDDNGLVIVSTPNPFFLRFIWRNLKEETFIANAEHVSWITPSMALEIARRASLELKDYWLLQSDGETFLKKIFHKLRSLFMKNAEFFTSSFIYVFKLQK